MICISQLGSDLALNCSAAYLSHAPYSRVVSLTNSTGNEEIVRRGLSRRIKGGVEGGRGGGGGVMLSDILSVGPLGQGRGGFESANGWR